MSKIGVTIRGTWNEGQAPELLELDPCAWYHVFQEDKLKAADIRGREIKVRDRIYMRGEWALVSRIRWRQR